MDVNEKVSGQASISIKVIRKDGTVEDIGKVNVESNSLVGRVKNLIKEVRKWQQ